MLGISSMPSDKRMARSYNRFRKDGQKIENLESYRTATDFFNLTYIKDNIFEVPAGTYKGVADGFFVFLKPLSAGNHDLHIKTSVTNPTTPSYNFA
jgi:hypothetical protein